MATVRIIGALAAALSLSGQTLPAQVSVSAQAYPAGFIATGAVVWDLGDLELQPGVGYNITDRRDFGVHENEEGSGPGLNATLIRRVGRRAFVGVRADLWRLAIEWRDPGASGRARVTVFQPVALSGLRFPISSEVSFKSFIAFGAEINIASDGEEVGEGAILLFGIGMEFGI